MTVSTSSIDSAPGIALARLVLDVLEDPDADRGVTGGELIEQIRQFAAHLLAWRIDPSSPDGYAPQQGVVALGHEPNPGSREPTSSLVLVTPR
ncbi:hypothetical protein ACW9HR_22420 [Nocardia gipuzkoensis]